MAIIERTIEGHPDFDKMAILSKSRQEMILSKVQDYGVMVTDCRGNIRNIGDIMLDLMRVMDKITAHYNYNLWRNDFVSNTNKSISPKDFKNVYFNAEKGTTVIKWIDDTITKVKVQTEKGDTYNPELGMAMCIAKKALGNKGNFNEVFKKFLPKED